MTRRAVLLFSLICCGALQAAAPPPKSPAAAAPAFQPHYVSQRPKEAYLREGPGYAYKVLWVYRHKGYPFQVTASYDIWRRVKDADGIVGWMSAQMLSDSRTVLVTGKGRAELRAGDDFNTKIVGLADPGAILNLKSCGNDMCRVKADGIEGWIAKSRVWGAQELSK